MDLSTLAEIVRLGGGVSHVLRTPEGVNWPFRTAPSGGGLYPVDLYCAALRVNDVAAGLYAYVPTDHCLQQVRQGDLREELSSAVPAHRDSIAGASACLILSGVMERSKFKYGERAYRFLLLEAGHIGQNLLLAAEAMGWGAFPVGGFLDDPVNHMMGFDGVEVAALYLVLIGKEDSP